MKVTGKTISLHMTLKEKVISQQPDDIYCNINSTCRVLDSIENALNF